MYGIAVYLEAVIAFLGLNVTAALKAALERETFSGSRRSDPIRSDICH